MRTRWLLMIVLAMGVLFYLSLRSQRTIEVGALVPDFSLPGEQGEPLTLDRFRGNVVILNFWATFCHTCATEMPSLNRLAHRFANAPVRIIGISEDGQAASAWPLIEAYQRRIPIDFPLALDPDGSVADRYGTFMLPESYLIDRRGRLVRKIVGTIAWDDPTMIAEIERLISR